MGNWNCFYLQKMGVDGNNAPYPVYESVTQWGVWCKEIPFKIFDKVKEPAKRTWNDEHGDDEYISADGLYLEAYTMMVEFGCKLIQGGDTTKYGVTVNDVRDSVASFLEYLRSAGMMKMYCSYTRIGRQYVRLAGVLDSAKWKSEDGQEFLVFEVEFKVNDPKTPVTIGSSSSS